MPYETMEKLFYKDNSASRFSMLESLAQDRREAPSSFKTGFFVGNEELFCAVPRELSVLLEQILRKERRVSALWRDLPWVARGAQIRSLIMDEVVYSNEIEGVRSTKEQVEAALDRAQNRSGTTKEKLHTPFIELARLYLGLSDTPTFPTSPDEIRNIYDAVTEGTIESTNMVAPGSFRTGQVVIENERGKVVHTGVVPTSIEPSLQTLIELAHSEDIPEVYAAALCHFMFEYTHPFYDGNGRTGRYLLALQLSRPLSQPTVLTLSRTIAENKAAYYKAFEITEKPMNHAEGTHFVLMVCELISSAQDNLIVDLSEKLHRIDEVNQRILTLRDEYDKKDRAALFYAAQMELFSTFGETRVRELPEYMDVSLQTARKVTKALEEKGLLVSISRRPATYRLSDLGKTALGLL